MFLSDDLVCRHKSRLNQVDGWGLSRSYSLSYCTSPLSELIRCGGASFKRVIMRPETFPEVAAEFLAQTLAATYPALPTILFATGLGKNAKLSHDQPTPRMEDVALDFVLHMSLEAL